MDAPILRWLRRTAILGTAASAGALVARLAERVWRSAAAGQALAGLTLPEGEERTVRTDDGAELRASIVEPASRRWGRRLLGRRLLGRWRAPTVVLVHCFACDRRTWAPTVQRLVESGYRVVLYDQRGHGASTVGTAMPTAAQLGDDLALVIRELGIRRAVVAGHSMGGFATVAFACDHPDLLRDRVTALVLVATAVHGVGLRALDPLAAWVLRHPALGWVMNRPRLGLALTRTTVGRRPDRAHLAATRDMFLATDAAVRAACFVGFSRIDHREDLAKVGVPTTVLVGNQDNLTPPRLARAIVDAAPEAELVIVDGAGHMLPLEIPDRVAEVIAAAAGG